MPSLWENLWENWRKNSPTRASSNALTNNLPEVATDYTQVDTVSPPLGTPPSAESLEYKPPAFDAAALYQPVTAPTIQLPDYTKMPSLPDYTARIEEAGRTATEAGLKQLQELVFAPEYERERGRIAARGLTGAGVETDILQNLMKSQETRAGEFASDIARQTFAQQTAEMQSLRQLTVERQNMALEQQFNAAMKSGDWQQAAQIHNQQTKLEIETLRQTNEENAIAIASFNADNAWKQYGAWIDQQRLDIENRRVEIEERGVSADEKLADLEEVKVVSQNVAAAGYEGQDYFNKLHSELEFWGLDEYFVEPKEGAEGGGGAEEYTGEPLTRQEIMNVPINMAVDEEQLIAAGGNRGEMPWGEGRAYTYRVGNVVFYQAPDGRWRRYS